VTQYAPNPPQQAAKPSNGLGITGFVLGLIGLLLSFIPIIGVVAWPLVILGIIFSGIGIAKASKGRATNKGLAITGLVVSIVGLVVCILWTVVWNQAVDEVDDVVNGEAKVVYEITGDATDVQLSYVEFSGDNNFANKEEAVATLPWTKEYTTTNLVKEGATIAAVTGVNGGSVTCKITINGEVVEEETASGVAAAVTCEQLSDLN
jgi:hypothetical protein